MTVYGVPMTTAHMHQPNGGRVLEAAGTWLTRGLDPVQTGIADAVAAAGMRPDLLLRCENMHTLIEGWNMPDDRTVVRCHQTGVSRQWDGELSAGGQTAPGANRSPRFAAAAGLPWLGGQIPATVGFVWDGQPRHNNGVAFLLASCPCAQRWPYWFQAEMLWQALTATATPTAIGLPLPDPCDCHECVVSERHAQ